MSRQDNHTDPTVADCAYSDLFAHHKGVINARRITDAHSHWQGWSRQMKVS